MKFTGDEWTHWKTSRGLRGEPTARMDFGWQAGAELGAWEERARIVPSTGVSATGEVRVASDHAYMTMARLVTEAAPMGRRRPRPFRVGARTGDPRTREEFLELTALNGSFEAEMGAAAALAEEGGGSALSGARAHLVGAAQAASDIAAAAKEVRAARGGRGSTPKARFEDWLLRLRTALQMVRDGRSPRTLGGTAMQCCKAVEKVVRRASTDGEAWVRVIAVCRRELRRAGKALRDEKRASDGLLYELAKDMTKPNVNALVRMQRAWKAMSGSRASTALEAVWEDDQPPDPKKPEETPRRRITDGDPEFPDALRKVGVAFVAQMSDAPACLPAFEAWCEIFIEQMGELSGTDGGGFDLVSELTWELFLEVLHSMPGGKAVGEGGFHAELLREAGEPAQRAFYRAMMSDVKGKRIPGEWKTVLYALLIKKAPCRADVVSLSERREIALIWRTT